MKLFGRDLEVSPFNSSLNKDKVTWDITQEDVYYRVEENLVSTEEPHESFRFKASVSSIKGPIQFQVIGKGNTLEEAEAALEDNLGSACLLGQQASRRPPTPLESVMVLGKTLKGEDKDGQSSWFHHEGEQPNFKIWMIEQTYPPSDKPKVTWYAASYKDSDLYERGYGPTPQRAAKDLEFVLDQKLLAIQNLKDSIK